MNKQNINHMISNNVSSISNDHVNNNNNAQNINVQQQNESSREPRRSLLVVRATHEYIPVNNDELHISPGDTITITNPEDGGWWEGTLGSKTGWFPSNYVVVVDDSSNTANTVLLQNTISNPEQTTEYKRLIIQELIDSESNYIQELEEFHDKLSRLNLIDPIVIKLKSAYNSIINSHKTHILSPLKSEVAENPTNFRVGRIFLSAAKFLENSHTNYCSLHPKFVQFVERNQDKFENSVGVIGPGGVLKVIMCLSAPFRRIEKYGSVLNELESHAEVFCSDKGDLKRGVEYFRELEKTLTSTRKQKEMELEVLTPGLIKELEGPEICTLGEILLMNLMFITGRDNKTDKQPRYFILFNNTILILYYDNTDSSFTYKGRVHIGGVTVINAIESNDEGEFVGFEIAGPTLHPITTQCQSKKIRNAWITKLNELIRATRCYSSPPPLQLQNNNGLNSFHHHQNNHSSTSPLHLNQQQQHHSQSQHQFNSNSKLNQQQPQQHPQVFGSNWNITRLRPSPPFNPFLAEYHKMDGGINNKKGLLGGGSGSGRTASGSSFVGSPVFGSGVGGAAANKTGSFSGFSSSGGGGSSRGSIANLVTNEDDFAILSIVDGFCVRGNNGVSLRNDPNNRSIRSLDYNINSSSNNNNSRPPTTPPIIVSSSSPSVINHNKSLPQLVRHLHDDISLLHEKIGLLTKQLDEEKNARSQLLSVIMKGQQQQSAGISNNS